jgi:hypothetical protein
VPLLARSTHGLLVGWRGATTLTEFTPRGSMQIPTGGEVQSLTHGPNGWSWTLKDLPVWVPLQGLPQNMGEPVRLLRGLQLDGTSGLNLLLQTSDGQSTVHWGDGSRASLALDADYTDATAGDVDRDECPELFTLSGAQLTVYYGACGSGVTAQSARLPAPTLPATSDFKLGHDVEIHTYIGQTVRVQLAHPETQISRFSARGGPLWLKVSPAGLLSYTPSATLSVVVQSPS